MNIVYHGICWTLFLTVIEKKERKKKEKNSHHEHHGSLQILRLSFFTTFMAHNHGDRKVLNLLEQLTEQVKPGIRPPNQDELKERRLGCRAGTEWRKRRTISSLDCHERFGITGRWNGQTLMRTQQGNLKGDIVFSLRNGYGNSSGAGDRTRRDDELLAASSCPCCLQYKNTPTYWWLPLNISTTTSSLIHLKFL